eukprot:TRINITY_DN10407_c0_g1_i1.p1 TRINITY_DN10407_c0_g1~~TRINITY_DN10407_c0_g1_i1.p1  ORF type:complete len:182 (-),score=26.66 TRINITY_DN10407_c0_g1_i1:142-687(-)
MFKKFTRDSITQQSQVKSSQIRGIKNKILEHFPEIEPYMDQIFPKKYPLKVAKSNAVRSQLLVVNNEVVFFEFKDIYIPTLRIIHKYPFLLTKVQVDQGAIKYVMGGANVMSPGLTSAGGSLENDFKLDQPVAIKAEGKKQVMGIGAALMSRDDIKSQNKGVALENLHYLGDGLWESGTLA